MTIHGVTTSSIAQGIQQAHQPGKTMDRNGPSGQPDEAVVIAKLRAQDRKVRAHEQAHQAAAGGLAEGGATFTLVRGPDGKQYAVGGEVNIDTAPVPGDPEATIRKARRIRAAALAPADPSPQDRAVAAQATAMEAQAAQQLNRDKRDTQSDASTGTASNRQRIDLYV